MAAAFLDRNKKKSLSAVFLAFLRRRRGTVLLLLLVSSASAVFLSPSSWMTGLPGGRRFASAADLLAAFRAAKTRGGGAGWGAPRGGSPSAANSLDFVKGRKADLERGKGTVAGIADPSDPRNRDGEALSEEDLSERREAGGLSGGAYATERSFRGSVGASRPPDGLARDALAGLPPLSTPSSARRGGAAKGALRAAASRALETRAMKGVLGAGAVGTNLAYRQLAEGSSRAKLGADDCKAPGCTAESDATNSGAMYDGNLISAGFLTSADPGASGSIAAPVDVPPPSSGSADAQKTATCAGLVQECAQSRTAPLRQEWADEAQLASWYGQLGAACGDPCHCGPCSDLQAKIAGLCGGDLAAQSAAAAAPCPPLPGYCGALGFTAPAGVSSGGAAQGYCALSPGQCGCTGLFCGLSCLL